MDDFDETMKDIKENLIARIQRQEQEIEDLKEQLEYQDLWRKEYLSRIDKAIEYITKQMKKYEGYDRDFEIVLSNIVVMLGSVEE